MLAGSLVLLSHLAAVCDASGPAPGPNVTRPECAVGWTGVALSVAAFGSFALPVKAPQVLAADVGPVVFQLWMSAAIMLTPQASLQLVPQMARCSGGTGRPLLEAVLDIPPAGVLNTPSAARRERDQHATDPY